MGGMAASARKAHPEPGKAHPEPGAATSRVPTLAEQLITFSEVSREFLEGSRAIRRAMEELFKRGEAAGVEMQSLRPAIEAAAEDCEPTEDRKGVLELGENFARLMAAMERISAVPLKQRMSLYISEENRIEPLYNGIVRGVLTEAVDNLAVVLDIPEDRRMAFRELIADFVDAARETADRAKEPPRLKWDTDRDADEDPAHFAHRAGYVHRGEISKSAPRRRGGLVPRCGCASEWVEC
jgi:hypothetical protein